MNLIHALSEDPLAFVALRFNDGRIWIKKFAERSAKIPEYSDLQSIDPSRSA